MGPLHSNEKTVSIIHITYKMPNVHFTVIDVAGTCVNVQAAVRIAQVISFNRTISGHGLVIYCRCMVQPFSFSYNLP